MTQPFENILRKKYTSLSFSRKLYDNFEISYYLFIQLAPLCFLQLCFIFILFIFFWKSIFHSIATIFSNAKRNAWKCIKSSHFSFKHFFNDDFLPLFLSHCTSHCNRGVVQFINNVTFYTIIFYKGFFLVDKSNKIADLFFNKIYISMCLLVSFSAKLLFNFYLIFLFLSAKKCFFF